MSKTNNISNVIGQDKLITDINRILEIFMTSACVIRPHFILTGPSGTGKSITIKQLCEFQKLGYLEINAAQLTKEGTSGNSLSKALTPLLQLAGKPSVVFVDEFDKLFISGNSNTELAHEITNGVQNEFLKVLESDTASVFADYGKYANASSKHVLFVFAGAFNGEPDITLDRLRELGLKTEFLGRVGLVYNAAPLALDSLYKIVDTSELLTNYCNLFENVDREKVSLIIKAHIKKTFEFNTLGARLINTLINQYFINGHLEKKEVAQVSFQKKIKL